MWVADRMPTHHAIEIRFLRTGSDGRVMPNTADDLLRITKLGENSVRVVYTERGRDGPTVDVSQFNYHQLIGYLYRVFWLLSLDDDPFDFVNLAIPGYPVILFKVASIKENMQHIMELMLNTCHAWPSIGRAEPDSMSSAGQNSVTQ